MIQGMLPSDQSGTQGEHRGGGVPAHAAPCGHAGHGRGLCSRPRLGRQPDPRPRQTAQHALHRQPARRREAMRRPAWQGTLPDGRWLQSYLSCWCSSANAEHWKSIGKLFKEALRRPAWQGAPPDGPQWPLITFLSQLLVLEC